MESIFFLIPVALVFLGIATWALFKALRQGQFEDLDHAAWTVIFEDREQRRDSCKERPMQNTQVSGSPMKANQVKSSDDR